LSGAAFGAYVDDNGQGGHYVRNNTFAANSGGYTVVLIDGPVVFDSDVVAGNAATGVTAWNSAITLYSDVYGNTPADFSGGLGAGPGTFQADPLFAAPGFALQAGSPCVDAGNPDPGRVDPPAVRVAEASPNPHPQPLSRRERGAWTQQEVGARALLPLYLWERGSGGEGSSPSSPGTNMRRRPNAQSWHIQGQGLRPRHPLRRTRRPPEAPCNLAIRSLTRPRRSISPSCPLPAPPPPPPADRS
jgi:hypothetical protein